MTFFGNICYKYNLQTCFTVTLKLNAATSFEISKKGPNVCNLVAVQIWLLCEELRALLENMWTNSSVRTKKQTRKARETVLEKFKAGLGYNSNISSFGHLIEREEAGHNFKPITHGFTPIQNWQDGSLKINHWRWRCKEITILYNLEHPLHCIL